MSMEKLESENKLLKEQIAIEKNNYKKLSIEIGQLTFENEDCQKEIKQLKNKITSLEEEIKQLKEENNKLKDSKWNLKSIITKN